MRRIIPDTLIIPILPGTDITAIVTIMLTIALLSSGIIEHTSTADALTTTVSNAKIIGMADMALHEAHRGDADMMTAADETTIAATTDINIIKTAQDKPCAVIL
jgi:hypothetical protein